MKFVQRALPWIFFTTLLLCFPACRSVPEGKPTGESFAGVTFQLEEQAHDGTYPVFHNQKGKVDANSDLLLTFRVPTPEEVGAASIEWERVQVFLAFVEELARTRAELNLAEVPLEDPEAVEDLRKRIEEHDERVSTMLMELEDKAAELGWTGDKFKNIMTGEFDGRKDAQKPYINISRWLRGEIERLTRIAVDFVESRDRVKVTVQAFLDPVAGERKAIHVENYDELPVGELRPIDRYSLRLTPAEENRLRMELRQSRLAAESIREISQNGKSLKRAFSAMLGKLEAKIEDFQRHFTKGLEIWAESLNALVPELKQAGENLPPEKKEIVDKLAENLEAFQKEVETIRSLLEKARLIGGKLKTGGTVDLEELLLGEQGIIKLLEDFTDLLNSLVVDDEPEWMERLEETKEGKRKILFNGDFPEEVGKALKNLLPKEVEEFFQWLQGAYAATLSLVRTTAEFFKDGKSLDILHAADTLGGTDAAQIPRGLDDLPQGRIELERAGWTLGDQVTLQVRFHEMESEEREGRLLQQNTYRMEAVLTGLHRRISGDLIFARAARGSEDAKDWKPNVAAVANWHYFIRDPQAWVPEAWNWLDPGLGVHLASLDQGDDTVEFGFGLNLSIWGGLLTGGVGWNLSVDEDHTYYFFGIDLVDVLSEIKSGLSR